MTEAMFKQMTEAIIDGDEVMAEQLAKQAMAKGLDPLVVLENGYFPGMQIVGDKFEKSEMWLPEIMVAAEAMEAAMSVLNTAFAADGTKALDLGKVVIGTIRGDVHDIGKNIVKTMLVANGFTVYDLGKDVPPEAFIERAGAVEADIIAMSALMTSTMLYMPEVIRDLKELGLRHKYKVIVGGAPIIPKWAEEIGADGYAPSASECVTLCKNLINAEVK